MPNVTSQGAGCPGAVTVLRRQRQLVHQHMNGQEARDDQEGVNGESAAEEQLPEYGICQPIRGQECLWIGVSGSAATDYRHDMSQHDPQHASDA